MTKLDILLIQKRFKELFGIDQFFMHRELSKRAGGYVFDEEAFAVWLVKKHGFEPLFSVLDVVLMKHGIEAHRFIEFLIKNKEE